jgi:hypothetical protein
VRSHSKKQTDSERFPWNNRVRIGQEFCFNEFPTLIRLALGQRDKSKDRQANGRAGSNSERRDHSIR